MGDCCISRIFSGTERVVFSWGQKCTDLNVTRKFQNFRMPFCAWVRLQRPFPDLTYNNHCETAGFACREHKDWRWCKIWLTYTARCLVYSKIPHGQFHLVDSDLNRHESFRAIVLSNRRPTGPWMNSIQRFVNIVMYGLDCRVRRTTKVAISSSLNTDVCCRLYTGLRQRRKLQRRSPYFGLG